MNIASEMALMVSTQRAYQMNSTAIQTESQMMSIANQLRPHHEPPDSVRHQRLDATATTGLPVVNQALEPEWVRHGSAATQKAYETALSFEQTLVEQLSQSLTATSGLGGESSQEGESGSEEGGSAAAGANSQLSSMLPQALDGRRHERRRPRPGGADDPRARRPARRGASARERRRQPRGAAAAGATATAARSQPARRVPPTAGTASTGGTAA